MMRANGFGICIDAEPHDLAQDTATIWVAKDIFEGLFTCSKCRTQFTIRFDCSGPMCVCGHIVRVHKPKCPGCPCETPVERTEGM